MKTILSLLLSFALVACQSTQVVKILNYTAQVENQIDKGTGTVIGKNKNEYYILTCLHVVINDTDNIIIKFYETEKPTYKQYKAWLIPESLNEETDIVVLKIITENDIEVAPKSTILPNPGETIYSCGAQWALQPFICKGIVGAFYLYDFYNPFLASISSFPGSSGGGIYNTKYELIGIISMIGCYQANQTITPIAHITGCIRWQNIKERLDSSNLSYVYDTR